MMLAELIQLVLRASMFLTVVALGLEASPRDVLALWRRPRLLGRSLLAMNVVMPFCAATLALTFEVHPAVEIALLALAVSPVPLTLPKKARRAGGAVDDTLGLLVAVALLAIVFVPIAVALLGKAFGTSTNMPPADVARLVLQTIIAPLGVGMAIRGVAPWVARRLAQPLASVATMLLLAAALPLLFGTWSTVVFLIGNGTVLVVALLMLVGLAAGHQLGGPDPAERRVLARVTAFRHPGVALAVAAANFPEQRLVPAAVLLYLLVSAAASVLYGAWSQRRLAACARAVAM